jgi:hypothetical protein
VTDAAIAALTHRDDGTIDDPRTPGEWDAWVSAGRTRNHLADDPLLDWLDRHGAENGFLRDDELEGYDPRTDFRAFIFERGLLFEEGVMRLVAERFPVTPDGSACRERSCIRQKRLAFSGLRPRRQREAGAVDPGVR